MKPGILPGVNLFWRTRDNAPLLEHCKLGPYAASFMHNSDVANRCSFGYIADY